ncbi:periplasmic binding protein, partial [mine drainage metagenome]
RAGVEVWISNHRSVAGILDYIRRLGALVGAGDAAALYARRAETHMDAVRVAAAALPRHPRVYFEEWDEPIIVAIQWVAELLRSAGGEDVFPEL